MNAQNLLFIFSDQHQVRASGCYGHPLVQTPHLDKLAASGTRLTNAYTTCPICVPARASLMTGQYVHQIGYWDNAFPYEGRVHGWGHQLKAHGFRVDSIGKLHFRGAPDDDNGFSEEIDPMYVVGQTGDVLGAIRDGSLKRNARPGIEEAGTGDSTYLQYDRRNANNAIQWLARHKDDDKPWVLFLSFVCPHPPFIAPQEYYNLYPLDAIELPQQWQETDWEQHPVMQHFREFFSYDKPFSEETIRRLHAIYYGVCTFLDAQIGRVLQALDETGLRDTTRIIYSSDHGEHLGARGLFGKFTMYEEAAAIPMIIAGADVPTGQVIDTPISLVDCYPTILEAVGCPIPDGDRPGESLWRIANQPNTDRSVLSEYHAAGSRNACYMLRDRQYKYVHYVDAPAQLFDLNADPHEVHNLAASLPTITQVYEERLRGILNPEGVNQRAKSDQRLLIEKQGGREAVIQRGYFQNSPIPGEKPTIKHT